MAVSKITDSVFSVGAVDWDRQLFDELIPLPDGTSYNAYIVKGEDRIALIDTVDPTKEEVLLRNLRHLGIDHIDYIVSNHAEQDHSGSIPAILELFPQAKVVTNPKCKEFLKDLLLIPDDKFVEIEDGQELSLGDKTLNFIYTPWVHWPETMSTYLVEDKILFSCDFFGSHRASSCICVGDKCKVIQDAKRYYAEIMMPFRLQIKKNIEKLSDYDIRFIAPSHGPVYDKPEWIMDAYKDWISDRVEKKVVIGYVSMHGSTQAIVEYLVDRFAESGVSVVPMNLTVADTGEFAMELVDAAALVFASPYVLAGAHPGVVYAAYLANALRPKVKCIGAVFSYGWGGRGNVQIKELLSNIRAEFLEPVMIKGFPKEKDLDLLDEFVDEVMRRLPD